MWKDIDLLWSHCFAIEFMQNMGLGSRESLDISVENCNLNAISFQLQIRQCEQARTVCVLNFVLFLLFDFTSETTNHSQEQKCFLLGSFIMSVHFTVNFLVL